MENSADADPMVDATEFGRGARDDNSGDGEQNRANDVNDEEKKTENRWQELDQDLLGVIFQLLFSVNERASVSAVCGHWRDVAIQNPPELPWIAMPSTEGTSVFQIREQSTEFFAEDHSEAAQRCRGAKFCGSFPGGWFVISCREPPGNAVANLATGKVRPLPNLLRVLENGADFSDHQMEIHWSAMSASTAEESQCIIAAVTGGHTSLAFWRSGMEHWTPPQSEAIQERVDWRNMVPGIQIEDILFHRDSANVGRFCVLTSNEQILWYTPVNGEDGALCMRLHRN